jgi:hypothetical protein
MNAARRGAPMTFARMISPVLGIGFVIIGFAAAAGCYWFGWPAVAAQYADLAGDE